MKTCLFHVKTCTLAYSKWGNFKHSPEYVYYHAGLWESTYVWVGVCNSASPAPNHLSQRGSRVLKPIISFQQLLGFSLHFPTVVRHAKYTFTRKQWQCLPHAPVTRRAHTHTSAHTHTNLTIAKTLALKTLKRPSLIGGNVLLQSLVAACAAVQSDSFF